MPTWLIVLLVIMIIIILGIAIYFRVKENEDHGGFSRSTKSTPKFHEFGSKPEKTGEEIVADQISKLLTRYNVKNYLYNNFYLPNNNYIDFNFISEIDHLLVMGEDIYVIETKWFSLEKFYSINEQGELISKEQRESPLRQNQGHIKTLINFLNSHNIRAKKIHNIVIFKEINLNQIQGNLKEQLFNLNSFLNYLIENETGVNNHSSLITSKKNQKIVELLNQISLERKFYQSKHKEIVGY